MSPDVELPLRRIFTLAMLFTELCRFRGDGRSYEGYGRFTGYFFTDFMRFLAFSIFFFRSESFMSK